MKKFTEFVTDSLLEDPDASLKAGSDMGKAIKLFDILKTLQLYNCGKFNKPGEGCIGIPSFISARRTRFGSQKDMFGHKLAIGDLVFVRKDSPMDEDMLDYCYGVIIDKKTNNRGQECFNVACGIMGIMWDPTSKIGYSDISINDLNQMRDNLELTSDFVYKYANILTIPGWELIHIASKNKVDAALNKLK